MAFCKFCGKEIPEGGACDCAESIKDAAASAVEGLKEKAENAAGAVKDKAEDAAEAVKDKAEDAVEAAKDKVEDAAKAVKDKVEDVTGTVGKVEVTNGPVRACVKSERIWGRSRIISTVSSSTEAEDTDRPQQPDWIREPIQLPVVPENQPTPDYGGKLSENG